MEAASSVPFLGSMSPSYQQMNACNRISGVHNSISVYNIIADAEIPTSKLKPVDFKLPSLEFCRE